MNSNKRNPYLKSKQSFPKKEVYRCIQGAWQLSIPVLAFSFVSMLQVANADDASFKNKTTEKESSYESYEKNTYKDYSDYSELEFFQACTSTCTTSLIQRSTITCTFTGNGDIENWDGDILDNEGNITYSIPDWEKTEIHELIEESVETGEDCKTTISEQLIAGPQQQPFYVEGDLEEPNYPGQVAVIPSFDDICNTEDAVVQTTQNGKWAPITTTTAVVELEYYVLGSTMTSFGYCPE